jgi:hypothetical protein
MAAMEGRPMSTPEWSVRRLYALDEAQIDALADLLLDCVDGGAAVSFMHPLRLVRAGGPYSTTVFYRDLGE